MNDNEKLIEEAAKAIMEASHGEGEWEFRELIEEELYLRRARAALAVFEKAHTPTDDERVWADYRDAAPENNTPDQRRAFFAALRRHVTTESSEPSDAQVLAAFNAFFDLEVDSVSEGTSTRMRAALRAAGGAR